MWNKIKKIFYISCYVFIAICSIAFAFFAGRSCSDRRRSTEDTDRTEPIRDGLESVETGIDSGKNHIRTARDILEDAIRRGKEKADSSMGNDRD